MATIKVFSLGGLDKKSNDLIRLQEKSSKMLNMEYDVQSQLKKRSGFSPVTTNGVLSLTISNSSFKEFIYYNTENKFLFFYTDLLYLTGHKIDVYEVKYDSFGALNRRLIYSFYGDLSDNVDDYFPVSSEENSLSLYFSCKSTKLTNFRLLKYDGAFITFAGLMAPEFGYWTSTLVGTHPEGTIDNIMTDRFNPPVGGANGIFFPGTPVPPTSTDVYYARIFAKYTDINNIVTYGPYVQSTKAYPPGSLVSVRSGGFTGINGYRKSMLTTYNITPTPYILNVSNRTISSSSVITNNVTTYAQPNTYVAGDRLLILNTTSYCTITSPVGAKSVLLEVESITSSTVTFTSASLEGISLSFTGEQTQLDTKCEFMVAISQTQDTGYYITKIGYTGTELTSFFRAPAENNSIFKGAAYASTPSYFYFYDGGFLEGALIPFEDIYDSTTLKTPPPVCNYLASYGDQLVYGNILGVYDTNNRFVKYSNNDLVMYSDVSTGDNCENVSESNRQKIGETWDGEISGIKRSNDSCMVFKTRGVFALDGVLIQGQYTLRKINTNFEGCTSFKSIVQADEGVYYQGHNGVYFTNGVGVEKLTPELDSLYLSGDYEDTRGVRLKKKQKTFFYTPSIVNNSNGDTTVVDYYYGQVYMWDSIVASNGLVEDKNGDIFYSNGTYLFKSNDTYYDNFLPISCHYSTTWHHASEPSLNKKWLSIRIFALTTDAFTVTVKTEGDWIEGVYLTSNDLTFTSSEQTKFIMLDMQTKKSLRVTFSNATGGENLPITGYEITYEAFNAVDKN